MPKFRGAEVDLFYELVGGGIPVVWIQGVGVVGHCWHPQVSALCGYSSLVIDNRGIGQSVPCRGQISIEAMAKDTVDLMQQLGWNRAHVVGHSMGGLIAQELAMSFPEKVKSLSLICTFAEGPEAARLTPWVLWMSLRTRIGSKRMRRKAFLEMIFSPAFLHGRDLNELAAEVAPLMGRDLSIQPPILMKQVMAMSKHRRANDLNKLASIPTFVLSAEKDPIAKPEYGRRLATAISGAIYHEVPDASHAVTIERAAEINDLLRDFISRVESDSHS